eukprot:12965949-Heterocapsa_arctica.AAC.1
MHRGGAKGAPADDEPEPPPGAPPQPGKGPPGPPPKPPATGPAAGSAPLEGPASPCEHQPTGAVEDLSVEDIQEVDAADHAIDRASRVREELKF